MPKKKLTLANPDASGAQAAMDSYRPSGSEGSMGLLVGTNAFMVWVLVTQGTLSPTSAAAILLYALGGALMLVWALNARRDYRRRRTYNRHVQAGNIITVHPYLVKAWDELRTEQGVHLSGDDRQVHMRPLFTAATELQDDLERRANAENEPELAEEKLLAEARIRARLAREVEALRAVQQAQQELAQIPAAGIDIVTPEEVQDQLRTLRARETASAEDEPSQEH